MRILFASTAGNGHLDPLLPVAEACREQGDEVFFTVPDRERPRAEVEGRGLICRPFADSEEDERDAALAASDPSDRDAGNRVVVREVFGRINTTAALASMRALIDELRPDLVVREPFEGASWLAAAHAGVPTVLVPCTPSRSMVFGAEHMLAGIRPLVDALGLELDSSPAQGARAVVTWNPAGLDGSWEVEGPVLRIAPDPPWPEHADGSERPRLFVCFGTVTGFVPGLLARIGRATLDALADLEVDARFAVGRGVDASALAPVPGHVEVVDFVPLREVLPRTDLALIHGGYGTTLGVVGAGVPSLVMPLFAMDQWDNATAVAEAGAGEMLDVPDQTPDKIRERTSALSKDAETAARARALSRQMADQLPLASISSHLRSFA